MLTTLLLTLLSQHRHYTGRLLSVRLMSTLLPVRSLCALYCCRQSTCSFTVGWALWKDRSCHALLT